MNKEDSLERLIEAGELEVAMDLCEEMDWSIPILGQITRSRFVGRRWQTISSDLSVHTHVSSWTDGQISSWTGRLHRSAAGRLGWDARSSMSY